MRVCDRDREKGTRRKAHRGRQSGAHGDAAQRIGRLGHTETDKRSTAHWSPGAHRLTETEKHGGTRKTERKRIGALENAPATAIPGRPLGDMANAAVFRGVYPREYVRAFLREGVRPDGRAPDRRRKTTVLRGRAVLRNAAGAALVRIGATAVIAAVQADIAEPREGAPLDGYLGALPRPLPRPANAPRPRPVSVPLTLAHARQTSSSRGARRAQWPTWTSRRWPRRGTGLGRPAARPR